MAKRKTATKAPKGITIGYVIDDDIHNTDVFTGDPKSNDHAGIDRTPAIQLRSANFDADYSLAVLPEKGDVIIGCMRHSISHWRKRGERIAKAEGVSERDREIYSKVVDAAEQIILKTAKRRQQVADLRAKLAEQEQSLLDEQVSLSSLMLQAAAKASKAAKEAGLDD